MEPISQSSDRPKRSKSHPSIVLTPSEDNKNNFFEAKSATDINNDSMLLSNAHNDDFKEKDAKKSGRNENSLETTESVSKPTKSNLSIHRRSVGSIFRKGRNLALLLSTQDKTSLSEVVDEDKNDGSEDQGNRASLQLDHQFLLITSYNNYHCTGM